MLKPKTLFVAPYPPSKVRIRTYKNLESLVSFSEVDLLYLDDGGGLQTPEGLNQLIRIPNQRRLLRIFRVAILALLRKCPVTYSYYYKIGIDGQVAELAQSYDLIFVERLPLFKTLKLAGSKVVFDAVDCFTFQTQMLAEYAQAPLSLIYRLDSHLCRGFERRLLSASKLTLVSSEREEKSFRKIGVEGPVEVYLHDLQLQLETGKAHPKDLRKFIFHGKLSYLPNRVALKKLEKIMESQGDDLYCAVAGPLPANMDTRCSQLEFLGFVSSLSDTFSKIAFGVYPIECSVGVPNKVLECMATGTPVLITYALAAGIPGIEAINGRGVVIAEIDSFGDQMTRLTKLTQEEYLSWSNNCLSFSRDLRKRKATLRSIVTSHLEASSPR